MKQGIFTIVSNDALTDVVYKMVLEGDTSAITNCGQFVDLRLPEKYLRRPISVCDYDEKTLTLIYKVVGSGTEIMAKLPVGTQLDVLTGLGNGYDTSLSGDRPVLVGGGVGVPPMFNLCKKLIAEGKHPQVVLGFNAASEIFLAEDFRALGVEVHIATADGSFAGRPRWAASACSMKRTPCPCSGSCWKAPGATWKCTGGWADVPQPPVLPDGDGVPVLWRRGPAAGAGGLLLQLRRPLRRADPKALVFAHRAP